MADECCAKCADPTFANLVQWPTSHVHRIQIDSAMRRSATEDQANFTIEVPTSFTNRVAAVRLESIQFRHQIFNVGSGVIIDFDEGGGEVSATLTPGQYTSATLATEVVTQLEAANGTAITYTVTANDTTRTFTITPSAGTIDLLFATGTNATSGLNNGGRDLNYAYALLGFSKADTGAAAAQTSDLQYNLTYHQYFYISILPLVPDRRPQDVGLGIGGTGTQGLPVSTELKRYMFLIPLDVTFDTYVLNGSNASTDKLVWINDSNNQRAVGAGDWNIRLFDHYGNALAVNNQEWNMVLTVYTWPEHFEPFPAGVSQLTSYHATY